MPDIDDLINSAMLGQPTKFSAAFDDIMGQKAVAAVNDLRVPIAQSMFGSEEDEDFDLEDEDFEEDEDEEELDDEWEEDIEDFDLEDEDLDLDDEDLEGFEDDGEDA